MTPIERLKLSNELCKLIEKEKDDAITAFDMAKIKKRASEIVELLDGPDYQLFPKEEVNQGFYHSSRQSESIAKNMQKQYYQVITSAIKKAQSEVKTPDQEKALKIASKELQNLYISKVKALASSRSGVTSTFMAGRSNFNSAQANRRGNAYDKVSVDFDNWLENVAPNYIWREVRNAMSNEQKQTEATEKQQALETKQNTKLEKDANTLWRILEPKKFPMDYSKDMLIKKISFNKDKVPSSITIAMKDGSYLMDDKIILNKIFKNMPEILDYLKAQGKTIPMSWAEVNSGT